MTARRATRVLVIEDEVIVGLELDAHLSELGYEVLGPVATYEAAMQEADRAPPDLILADIRIASTRSGLEAGADLRRRHGSKLLVLTAHSDASTRERAKQAGADAVLYKPFRAADLRREVRLLLGHPD